MEKLYGFFSKKQKKRIGSCLYETPEGKLVEVTEVKRNKYQKSNWDDQSLIGEVTDFLQRFHEPIRFM